LVWFSAARKLKTSAAQRARTRAAVGGLGQEKWRAAAAANAAAGRTAGGRCSVKLGASTAEKRINSIVVAKKASGVR